MKLRALLVIVAWLAAVPSIQADGGVSRPATPAEQQYSFKTLQALQKALPKLLAGYEAADETAIEPFENVDENCEVGPLRVDYSVTWVNPALHEKEQAEEGALMEKLGSQMKADPGNAKMEKLMARQEKLAEEFSKAYAKNDTAKVKKIQAEMEAIGKEVEKIGAGQSAAVTSETRKQVKKSSLEIRLEANAYQLREILLADFSEQKPCAGQPVYRYHDADGDHTDTLEVYLGPWKKTATQSHAVIEFKAKDAPHTKVQNLRVVVKGHPELARQVLDGINWALLKSLL